MFHVQLKASSVVWGGGYLVGQTQPSTVILISIVDLDSVISYVVHFDRYLMLIDGGDQVYMVDRDNAVFHVPGLEFPRRKDLSAHIENTLVDGVRRDLSV